MVIWLSSIRSTYGYFSSIAIKILDNANGSFLFSPYLCIRSRWEGAPGPRGKRGSEKVLAREGPAYEAAPVLLWAKER